MLIIICFEQRVLKPALQFSIFVCIYIAYICQEVNTLFVWEYYMYTLPSAWSMEILNFVIANQWETASGFELGWRAHSNEMDQNVHAILVICLH